MSNEKEARRFSIHDRKTFNACLMQDCYKAVGNPAAYNSPGEWTAAIQSMQSRAIHAAQKKYMRLIGMDSKYPKVHQGPREMERRRLGGFARSAT